MRVIAGYLGGRSFAAPKGHRTHPMSDRVRGGLFNALGDVQDLTVLDAFAGSGALGFEAASRGAKRVVSIEEDRTACVAIQANIRLLGVQATCRVVQAGVAAWHKTADPSMVFDIVLCDPPYDNTQLNVIASLADRLVGGGLLVLSWPGKQEAPTLECFTMLRAKSYGDAQLVFYELLS